jgi:hypothetical protein
MHQANAGGFAISLVFHALAAFAAGRIAWTVAPAAPPESPRPNVVWFGAWSPVPDAGDQTGPDEIDSEPAAAARGAVPTVAPPAAAPATTPPGTTQAPDILPLAPEPTPAPSDQASPAEAEPAGPPPPGPALDWSDLRRKAIEDFVEDRERSASYRSFSFPGTLAEEGSARVAAERRRVETGQQPVQTVFDSPSKGRAGLAAENPLGEYIVWVSDDCYARYGTNNLFILPTARGLFDAPMHTCVSVQPRDDLFEHATPAYLLGVPEHDEHAQRSRHTDAGAVASFD